MSDSFLGWLPKVFSATPSNRLPLCPLRDCAVVSALNLDKIQANRNFCKWFCNDPQAWDSYGQLDVLQFWLLRHRQTPSNTLAFQCSETFGKVCKAFPILKVHNNEVISVKEPNPKVKGTADSWGWLLEHGSVVTNNQEQCGRGTGWRVWMTEDMLKGIYYMPGSIYYATKALKVDAMHLPNHL